ncbi:hypothetical protein ACHAWF_006341 [Thalassiosira exigua]
MEAEEVEAEEVEAASSATEAPPSPPSSSPTLRTALATAALITLNVVFSSIFQRYTIPFPSSLAGCGALFGSMLLLDGIGGRGQPLYKALNPGEALLSKWLPVFFVPSLIALPLASGLGSATEVRELMRKKEEGFDEVLKLLAVIVGGFFFTLFTTAWSVLGVRKLTGGDSGRRVATQQDTNKTGTALNGTERTPNETERTINETERCLTETTLDVGVDEEEGLEVAPIETAAGATTPATKPPPPFGKILSRSLTATAGITCISTVVLSKTSPTSVVVGPMQSAFLLFVTLSTFVFGANFPKLVKKVVHPLVTCTCLTWLAAYILAKITGSTFLDVLRSYTVGTLAPMSAGAGDILFFFLGPAVVALACQMYGRKDLIRGNIAAVATSTAVSSVGGLFGTAAAVRVLVVANPTIRLSLLSRNITSPLAMTVASNFGADTSLTVTIVVVTGLIGANFGAWILDAAGIRDSIVRGLGIGAAAHGLGTAALANEGDAFPFAAIAMALTASATTVLVSVHWVKYAVVKVALG